MILSTPPREPMIDWFVAGIMELKIPLIHFYAIYSKKVFFKAAQKIFYNREIIKGISISPYCLKFNPFCHEFTELRKGLIVWVA